MLSGIKLQRALPALVILCIVVRLIFICGVKQIPVMWDARLYSSAALGLIHYAGHPDKFGHPENDSPTDSISSRTEFIHTMREYISGEQIEWLHYSIPTVSRAQHYIFLSGPVLPAYLAVLFLINIGSDFTVVRTFNVILDSFCLILLMLIAARLIDNRTAVLAGIIYVFYLPFILLTGMVSPEPITILLILLSLYLILLWYDRRKAKHIYLCGLTLGLLVLTKPAAVLLFVPFAAGFLYDNRKNLRDASQPLIKAAVPFLAVTIPWVIIASLYFGGLSVRDPEYSMSNLRSSSSIEYEGYDRDFVEKDFWIAPVFHDIRSNPLGYGRLLLKKFVRLWAQPYNDFNRSFIMTKDTSSAFHFLIVLTALFGLFYFFIDAKRGLIFLFLIPLYYTAIHVIFHSLARYNLNAMPLVIITSSLVVIKAYDYIRNSFSNNKIVWITLRLMLCLIGSLILLFFPWSLMITLFGVGGGVVLFMILKIFILAAMLYYLFKIISEKAGREMSLKLIGIPSMFLFLVLLFLGSTSDSWAEWKCRLDNPGRVAGVRIYIPDDFRLQAGEPVRIGIDMTANRDRKNPFLVTISDRKAQFYIDRPPISEFYYRKATYRVFEMMHDIKRGEMRAWSFIPLNAAMFNRLLDSVGYIEITITTSDSFPVENNFIDLFGDYLMSESKEILVPGFSHYSTSIERFVEKGDPRIWMKYTLSSDSVISYYIDDVKKQRYNLEDLSPSISRQYGRYRIYIEVKKSNEAMYYF